jgi:hypothetical protein
VFVPSQAHANRMPMAVPTSRSETPSFDPKIELATDYIDG